MIRRSNESSVGRLWRIGKAASRGVVASTLAGGCADRLVFFPRTDPIHVPGVERRVINPDNHPFEVWRCKSPGLLPDEKPRAYVLCFIGNAARAEWVAPAFAEDWGSRPVEVWAVNYPGYGGSPGPARLSSIGPTALTAFDALRVEAGNLPIFIDAQSIGTAAGLYVAANRPVAGCVVHNPPPLRKLILGRFGWWNLWLVAGPVALSIPATLDSIANAKAAKAPALFMMADADEVVPPQYQKRVFDAYAGEKRAVHIPGAGHNDSATGDALIDEQRNLDWLWRLAGLELSK